MNAPNKAMKPRPGKESAHRRPPLGGYVEQRRPHKIIITGQRDDIASQWMAPDEFDPMSPRHPEERSIERDESRDVGMTAPVKVHHGASR
jgi:hypothetical protein